LLPYILELMDDDEEVLLALSETLGSFLDYAGGPQHAEHVLRPLEKLCAIEESTVREKVSSDSKIYKTCICSRTSAAAEIANYSFTIVGH